MEPKRKPASQEAPTAPVTGSAAPPHPERPIGREKAAERPARHSRRTPAEQTRLFMNVGKEMGVGPGDVVGTILGETGLPASVIGVVDIRDRHLFVDVAAEHAKSIISKLNRTSIRSHRLKVKEA